MFTRHTHSDRLERWLGKEQVEDISRSMVDWYGPPIPIRGVPGAVYAARGGDFLGPIQAGRAANLLDFARDHWAAAQRRWAERQRHQFNAGFGSLGDMISEATAGKKIKYTYNKTGVTSSTGYSNTLWRQGASPPAGSAASAAPAGDAPTSATTGAMPYTNPSGGDTLHLTRWDGLSSIGGCTLLLYDRIFQVAKTMNSTATEAVTGVPTRYTNTTANSADSAEGNFLTIECGTVLAGAAHNWTVCEYTDQAGNTGATLPSVTGTSSCPAGRLDLPPYYWFCPLASGDSGILALTQMQCSALVATGTIDFVIGHPLAFMPHHVANFAYVMPLINDAFNVERVHDSACLAFLEINKPSNSATTYTGLIDTVYG